MPAASSGKRSFKVITARSYEGLSASQQVKAAQWTGQLAWVATDHPSSKSKENGGYTNWQRPEVDFNKPWFRCRDGEFYCDLCGAWATPEHVASDKHSRRAENPSWYGFGTDGDEPDDTFNKPWFTSKGGGEYYCELCGAMATEGHIASDKHRKRAANPEWYGFPNAVELTKELPEPWVQFMSEDHQRPWYFNQVTKVCTWDFPGDQQLQHSNASAAAVLLMQVPAVPPEFQFPWFEQREGHWFCKLCNSYATDAHMTSQKHQKRAAWPSSYGFPDSSSIAITVSKQPMVDPYSAPEQVPAPFETTIARHAQVPPVQSASACHDEIVEV